MAVTAAPWTKAPPERFGEGNARLRGVEIFAAGTHRGKTYTTADLDQMVENFGHYSSGAQPALRVPAVIGHEEDQEYLENSGLPAAGWAQRVYRDGTKLKADFGDVAPKVVRLLKGKAYRTVSSEVSDKVPSGLHGEGTPTKMLRRVAFLGGEIPQVKTLEDIPAPEEHGERASYEAVPLKFSEARRFNFSEVKPMDRAAMLEQLAQMGFSADAFPDTVPDPTLAEILRVCSEEEAAEEEPTDAMPADKKKALGEGYAAKMKHYRELAERCGEKFDDGDDDGAETMSSEDIAKRFEQDPGEKAMWAKVDGSGMTSGTVRAQGGGYKPGKMKGRWSEPTPTPESTNAPDPNVSHLTGPAKPKKVTHTMQFSEADLKAVAKLAAAELKKEFDPLKGKVDQLDKFAEQRIVAEKRATVKAKMATFVQQGKVLPAELDAGLEEVAYQLDAATVHKFSEGGKEVEMTSFDRFFKTLEARPVLVKFGERVKGPAKGHDAATADEAKLEEHYEQFSEQFERNGLTKEKLLSGFKAEKACRPKLTAEEFLSV